MALISLIIPVYNVEPYLKRCLDSILTQSFDTWEAILIDDGSMDQSGRICDEYALKDSRFRVFHKPNGGVSTARNIALDNAKGDWIWFVDSDDYIMSDALSTLNEIATSNVCDTIFFGMKVINRCSATNVAQPSISNLSRDAFLSRISCFANPTMLFSREIIQKHALCFSEGIKMGEDLEFQYKYLSFIKSPISISSMLYVYMRRDDSAMNNPSTHINNYNDCLKVSLSLLEFIEVYQIPYADWLMIRIRQIIKSAMLSASRIVDIVHLKKDLQNVVSRFESIGWGKIKDFSIRLALFNQNIYFISLRIYQLLRK